jgi:hypothetical protein
VKDKNFAQARAQGMLNGGESRGFVHYHF